MKKPVKKGMGGSMRPPMPTQAAGGMGRAAANAPALPAAARGARPFKKGGAAKGKKC
tara:strand:- start:707 stop:877 length:171 start_codon:yes stop_codon:yes gene_type:complete